MSEDQFAKLSALLADTNNKVADVSKQLTDTDSRVTGISEQLTGTNNRVEDISRQLTDTNNKVAVMSEQLTETNNRVANMSKQLTDTNSRVTGISDQLTATNAEVAKLNTSFVRMYGHFSQRFDMVDQELAKKADAERVYKTLDQIVGRLDTDEIERSAIASHQERQDGWFKQLASATNTKLVPEL